MMKYQKSKIKSKYKKLSKILNILSKKTFILKLKSNSINIKSKKSKFLIRKIKDYRQKKTLNS